MERINERGETFATVGLHLEGSGADLLAKELDNADAGSLVFTPQSSEGVAYAERFSADDRFLDLSGTVVAALRTVRALTPHIGARLVLEADEVLGIREASLSDEKVNPGEISLEGPELLVGFTDGSLRVDRLVPPGGKEMAASDWLRGRAS